MTRSSRWIVPLAALLTLLFFAIQAHVWAAGDKLPKPQRFAMTPAPLPQTASGQFPKWFFLVNGLSATQNPERQLALTVDNAQINAGTQLVLQAVPMPQPSASPVPGSSEAQLWQYTSLGYLNSGLGNGLMAGFNPTGPAPYNAVIYPSQAQAPKSTYQTTQQWSYSTVTAELTSNDSAVAPAFLYAPGDEESTPVQLGTNSGSAPGNQWYAWPSYPLEAIVNEPNQPFPTQGPKGQKLTPALFSAAYNCLNQSLSPEPTGSCTLEGVNYSGLRCEYVNNDPAALSTWSSQLTDVVKTRTEPLFCKNQKVPTTAVLAVAAQLSLESADAAAVQTLIFEDFQTFFTSAFVSNQELLTQLATAVGISNSTKVTATTDAFLEGGAYTVLSALGPGTTVIANIMEWATNTANADNSSAISKPFTVEVSDLYSQLETNYKLVLNATGTLATTILSDWGRLRRVALLSVTVNTPDSLAWPVVADGSLLDAASAGYTVKVMQLLLPARGYNIYSLPGQVENVYLSSLVESAFDSSEPAPPDGDQWVQNEGSGLFTNYFITDKISGSSAPPSPSLLQDDVFNNGASQHDFYTDSNGWNFTQNNFDIGCWGQIIGLTNYTPDEITVKVTPDEGLLGGNGIAISYFENDYEANVLTGSTDPVTKTMAPFGSVGFAGVYNGNKGQTSGLVFDVDLYDPNYQGGTAPVASFQTHQHSCGDIVDLSTWVSNVSTVSGYALTSPKTKNPSLSLNGNAGVVTAGLYTN